MASIKVRQSEPYLVGGDDVTLLDGNGVSYPVPRRPFAPCRAAHRPSRFTMARIHR